MNASQPFDALGVPLSGVHLIEASAGTGKTHTITSLIVRAVVERASSLEKIVAVTFTNAATAELRERVGARLEQARLVFQGEELDKDDDFLKALRRGSDSSRSRRSIERALTDVDKAAIFTIHGFAQRLLADFAFESGAHYDVELVGDQARLVYDSVVDFWSTKIAPLSVRELRWLGGPRLFSNFQNIAKEAAGSADVPMVTTRPAPGVEAAFDELAQAFAGAKRAFDGQTKVLADLIRLSGLNKKTFSAGTVTKNLAQLERYFEENDAFARPDSALVDRYRASNFSSRLNKNGRPPDHDFFTAMDRLADVVNELSAGFELRLVETRVQLVEFVRRRVAEQHLRDRTQSFDDLLSRLRTVLRDSVRGAALAARIRARYDLVLIDEFQDTDPVQYEIFQRLFGAALGAPPKDELGLFLIGDPKQSIYAFRGADVQSYLAASRDGARRWTLGTSYRASPSLVRAQNALFELPEVPFGHPGIGYEATRVPDGKLDVLRDAAGDPLPALVIVDNRDGEVLLATAKQIAGFLAEKNRLDGVEVSAGNLAVLTRRNADALTLQRHLTALGVPAVMHGDRSVFEQPEAYELRRILLALTEPSRASWVRTALGTRLLGLGARQLHELDLDDGPLESWFEQFRARAEDWKSRGVAHALERLAQHTGLVERTLRDRDGERRLTNYRHLLELLHEAETRRHLGVAGLFRYFESAIADPMGHEMAAEAKQVRLESDADAVTLTTVHKSKGLEYDIVFLAAFGSLKPYAKKDVFRFHEGGQGDLLLEVRSGAEAEESQAWAARAEIEESLRIAYVALTRPRHQLRIMVDDDDAQHISPLSYWFASPAVDRLVVDKNKAIDVESRVRGRQRLREVAGTAVAFVETASGAPAVAERSRTEVRLVAAASPQERPEGDRTSSFSAMTRHGARLSRASREGRDIDEQQGPGLGDSGLVATKDAEVARSPSADLEALVFLADFPRGPGPGEALHGVFERGDFFEGSAEGRIALAEEELARRGLDRGLSRDLAGAVEAALDTPLSADTALRLRRLRRSERRVELEFSLPVGTTGERLSARSLARALRGSDLADEYLREVEQLGFPEWSGYLRGFIDLVFEADGRFYVVDYKSNYLGDRYGHYQPPALEQAMREHHYHLQARLYALAVHRHLECRVPGYDYERHFGGVFYLFVRGMSPQLGPRSGVHFALPPRDEMQRLSALFQHPGGVGHGGAP